MKQFLKSFHNTYAPNSYNYLGSHYVNPLNPKEVTFRVYAPHAQGVSLVGDFNNWDQTKNPLQKISQGVWEVKIAPLENYSNYKYAITYQNKTFLKQDPYAYHFETDGSTSSKVYHLGPYPYQDNYRQTNIYKSPLNIYEVNFASWKRHEKSPYSYYDLARELIPYVKEMGYTHIEIMPIMEYPFAGSWGYQVTGYFGITSRFGTPDDFRYFVHKAHEAGLGVILDWVPAHFAKDDFGLINYDGTYLYEDPEPTRMEHESWGTRIFNFAKPEVKSFLISSALFYFDKYNIDGLRVDAVASMLYLDYDRKVWKKNYLGNNLNLEAIDFLKTLNNEVRTKFPHAIMIAEESTAYPLITKPTNEGGLGFHFKWNMGWMNDTLKYIKLDPLYRHHHHHHLTFSLMYAFNEHYVLPFSHDEVVHGKYSLINKMPGEYKEKFANLRCLYTYMMTHPGKKLSFMGNEFAQFIEWNYNQALDWLLLSYPQHKLHHHYIKTLNHLYLENSALYEEDDSWDGFKWNISRNQDNVIAYSRKNKQGELLLIIINFSGSTWKSYRLGVEQGKYKLLLNSDEAIFGGNNLKIPKAKVEAYFQEGYSYTLITDLPALSALIYKKI